MIYWIKIIKGVIKAEIKHRYGNQLYSRGGLLGWIQQRWFEFRQGHGTYLGFVLSFVNFVLIAYSLFLEKMFRNLTLLQFCLIFGSLYVPTGVIIGRLHIKKQVRYDTGMIFNQNPGLQAMMEARAREQEP